MRFAASVNGIRRHCTAVDEELTLTRRVIDGIETYIGQVVELVPDEERELLAVCQNLRKLKSSMELRKDFLEETADEVQKMLADEIETGHQVDDVLKKLGIKS